MRGRSPVGAAWLAPTLLSVALVACEPPSVPSDGGSSITDVADAAQDVRPEDSTVERDVSSPIDATTLVDGGADAATDAPPAVDAGLAIDVTMSCSVEAPTSCPDPAPRYAEVEPIFMEHCIPCHYGAIGGPWPLRGYDHVADWQDTIRDELLRCSMPPADAGAPLPDDRRRAILVWLRCGLPR